MLTQDNVGLCSFLCDYRGAGEVAVDKTNGGMLGCDRGTALLAADDAGVLPVGVRFIEDVESVAADVACHTGPARW